MVLSPLSIMLLRMEGMGSGGEGLDVEGGDGDGGAAEVVEKAKAAFAQMNPDSEIKTVDVYVKPDEGVAYYAVNGEGSADYKIEL